MFLCLAAASLSVSAQQVNERKVPVSVKEIFTKAYPNTAGKWVKEDGNFEVTFDKDTKKMTLVINQNGSLIQTEYAIKKDELPKSVIEYLDANYKGVKIVEMAHILKPSGEIQFEAEVKGKDILLDGNGKFLSKEK